MRPILFCAMAMALLVAGPAAARESACIAEAKQHCPDIPPGDGRVIACLKTKWFQLSSSCQQDVEAHQARVQSLNLSCANDLWTHCQGVAPGQGRIYSCLISAWDRVSSTCRDRLTELYEKLQSVHAACEKEIADKCAAQTTPVGKLYLCLKWHEAKLSSRCQSALNQ